MQYQLRHELFFFILVCLTFALSSADAAAQRNGLLVIQGATDPRVVKGESDQMVEKLKSLGREVEYVVFDDEGHGFTKRPNELKAYGLATAWLERHLTRT